MYTSLTRTSYTRETCIVQLLGVENYLNTHFAMYTSLPRSFYMLGACIPHLLGVENYLNNYFAIYTSLTGHPLRVVLASLIYLGLRII